MLAKVLLVIGLLLLPLGLAGRWATTTLIDEQGYVAAVGPLAGDPRIQETLVEAVTGGLITPEQAADLVPLLPDEFVEAAVQAVLDRIDEAAASVVASEQFANVWTAANADLHSAALALLEDRPGGLQQQGDDLVLDLQPLRELVRAELQDLGVPLPPSAGSGSGPFVVVAQDANLAFVRAVYSVGRPMLAWFLLLPIALIVAGVLLAPDRLRALHRAGLGLLLVAAAMLVGWLIGRLLADGLFDLTVLAGTGTIVYDALTASILSGIAVTAVVGAGAAVAGWWWSAGRRGDRGAVTAV